MLVRYYIPEHGDDPAHPNAFVVNPRSQGGITLGEIKDAFPLSGDFFFRFKKNFQSGHIWLDVAEDHLMVPAFGGDVLAKVQVKALLTTAGESAEPVAVAAATAPLVGDVDVDVGGGVSEANLVGDAPGEEVRAPDLGSTSGSEKLLSFRDEPAEPAPAAEMLPFADDLVGMASAGTPAAGTPAAAANDPFGFNAFGGAAPAPAPAVQQATPGGGLGNLNAFNAFGGQHGMGQQQQQQQRGMGHQQQQQQSVSPPTMRSQGYGMDAFSNLTPSAMQQNSRNGRGGGRGNNMKRTMY